MPSVNTSDLSHFAVALSSFTGNLESQADALRASISSGSKQKATSRASNTRFLDRTKSMLSDTEAAIVAIEDDLIGNPDACSLGDMADMCAALQESNENKMNGIGIILRQYGYKGPSISSPKSAVIVEQEEEGEEGSIQDNDDESNENSNDDDDTSEKENMNMNKTVCSDGGGSAEPSIPEEAVDEKAEAEAENNYTTPAKPGSLPKKAKESPETPATPELEGISEVSKSVIRGSPLTSSKKISRLAAASHNSAVKTPKPSSVASRLAALKAELSSAKPAVAFSSAKRSTNTSNAKVPRSSISFATSTSFTPSARRRKFVTTPHSDKSRASVATPVAAPVASAATPAAYVPAPHVSPVVGRSNISKQVTTPAAIPVNIADPGSGVSSDSAPSTVPSTPDFAPAPAAFVSEAEISQSTATAAAAAAAASTTSSSTAASSPAAPTARNLPATPFGADTSKAPIENSTPPEERTPELPVFSTVKKAKKVDLDANQQQDATPPTPPQPNLLTLSSKKAVKESLAMASPEGPENANSGIRATPPVPALTMSTKKSARANARLSANFSESCKSPEQTTPTLPVMKRSAVRNISACYNPPLSLSFSLFNFPPVLSFVVSR
ncbi:MAG: hypothetical protein CMO44_18345 [Verrucomicrobiales bacterium]|nr:hypothetical protein [Verrucomicrobiales bacterium]